MERLEKAYAAFGERVDENGEMTDKYEVKVPILNEEGEDTGELTTITVRYDGQMQQDGIAADIADFVKKIFGSKNTANKIRSDLKLANEDIAQLKEALLKSEEDFKAKFKEIFGIDYDYRNIVAYQKNKKLFSEVASYHYYEMGLKRNLKTLLSPAPLRDEIETSTSPSTHATIRTVTASKEQVYTREYENLKKYLGEEGEAYIQNEFSKKGVTNASIEEKFEVLKNIANDLAKKAHAATLEVGNGEDFSLIESRYENSYKSAYGVENDILKRINDYNISQEIGKMSVKIGGVIALSMITGGAGASIATTAATTAVGTVLFEVADSATSGNALNTLREEGVGEYIIKSLSDVDWEATLKQAAISGGAVLIGGAVAKGISFAMQGQTPIAQAAAMFGSDVLLDMGLEFVTTGKITIENVVYTVALSLVGNSIQLLAIKRATENTFEGFKAKCDKANSIQDFEKLVHNAKSLEELDYIKGLITNSVINRTSIDDLLVIINMYRKDILFDNLIQKYPDVMQKLSSMKTSNGQNMIEPWDIKTLITRLDESDLANPTYLYKAIEDVSSSGYVYTGDIVEDVLFKLDDYKIQNGTFLDDIDFTAPAHVETPDVKPLSISESIMPDVKTSVDINNSASSMEANVHANLKEATASEIVRRGNKNYEIITDPRTGKVLSETEVGFNRASVKEVYVAKDGSVVEQHKIDGVVIEKTIVNPDKSRSLLIYYDENGAPVQYYDRYYADGSDRATSTYKYNKNGELIQSRSVTTIPESNATSTETLLYLDDGVAGKVEISGEEPRYYEISDYTKGQKEYVNYSEFDFNGLHRKSLFNLYPKFN